MMQLPHEMRDTLVETLDEYLEAQTGNPEPESVARDYSSSFFDPSNVQKQAIK